MEERWVYHSEYHQVKIMKNRLRTKEIVAPPSQERAPPHVFGEKEAIVRGLIEGARPHNYTTGPVKIFDTGRYKGIGRNYEGYRVIYAPKDGFHVYDSAGIECKTLADERIDRFKQDVLEAARSDIDVAAFVDKNRGRI
jgi:hypothetical protein